MFLYVSTLQPSQSCAWSLGWLWAQKNTGSGLGQDYIVALNVVSFQTWLEMSRSLNKNIHHSSSHTQLEASGSHRLDSILASMPGNKYVLWRRRDVVHSRQHKQCARVCGLQEHGMRTSYPGDWTEGLRSFWLNAETLQGSWLTVIGCSLLFPVT